MGEYADMIIDDVMDGNIPEDVENPADAHALRREAAPHGLAVRKCSNVHYQICDASGPLVDVWPTTNKFRWHGAPAGAKAKSGGPHQAVKHAIYTAKLNGLKAAGKFAPRAVDADPFADEPAKLPPAIKASRFGESNLDRCQQSLQAEAVNHPSHYKLGTMEVIDAIEGLSLGFHAGNVVKYVARYKAKGGVEDLRKAKWYLERLIELETRAESTLRSSE